MSDSQNEQAGESHVQEYEEGESADQGTVQQPIQQGAVDDLPIKEGAAIGAVAAIATYLVHLLLTIVAMAQATPATDTEGDPISMVASWEAAGWSYLATFGAGFEADGEVATLSDAPNHAAAFAAPPISLGTLVLFTVSVGSLVAAGYAIAKYTDAEDAVDAAKTGLTVVPAYLVIALVIAVAMTHTYGETLGGGESVTFSASTTGALLYAGILFPVVFATVGAVITQRRDAVDKFFAKVA